MALACHNVAQASIGLTIQKEIAQSASSCRVSFGIGQGLRSVLRIEPEDGFRAAALAVEIRQTPILWVFSIHETAEVLTAEGALSIGGQVEEERLNLAGILHVPTIGTISRAATVVG